jgi:hypothetical protein
MEWHRVIFFRYPRALNVRLIVTGQTPAIAPAAELMPPWGSLGKAKRILCWKNTVPFTKIAKHPVESEFRKSTT